MKRTNVVHRFPYRCSCAGNPHTLESWTVQYWNGSPCWADSVVALLNSSLKSKCCMQCACQAQANLLYLTGTFFARRKLNWKLQNSRKCLSLDIREHAKVYWGNIRVWAKRTFYSISTESDRSSIFRPNLSIPLGSSQYEVRRVTTVTLPHSARTFIPFAWGVKSNNNHTQQNSLNNQISYIILWSDVGAIRPV